MRSTGKLYKILTSEKMGRYFAKRLITFLSVLLVVSSLASASSDELQKAVTVYYAGHPHEAVDMIKPLAAAGDVEAQYLLGNILYSLSKTQQFNDFEDPTRWYQMAADQGVADASYALGVIHNNNWDKSRDKQQAALAITHFHKAFDQGFKEAELPLEKLISRSGLTLKKAMKLARKNSPVPVVEAKPVIEAAKEPEAMVVAKVAVVKPIVETDTVSADEAGKAIIVVPDEIATPSETDIDEDPIITIQLADIVDQCTKYTREGFDYYADTIRGAILTGRAKIKSIRADPANPGAQIIQLRDNKFGMTISFNLNEVPNSIANNYQAGDQFRVSGIITDSKIAESSCEVNVAYQLAGS